MVLQLMLSFLYFWDNSATEKAESLASLFATNSTLDDKGLNPPSYTATNQPDEQINLQIPNNKKSH